MHTLHTAYQIMHIIHIFHNPISISANCPEKVIIPKKKNMHINAANSLLSAAVAKLFLTSEIKIIPLFKDYTEIGCVQPVLIVTKTFYF